MTRLSCQACVALRRAVSLFAGAMAVFAFALPSMAAAASWGPLNSHHVLDSPNFGFTGNIGGAPTTSLCTRSSFTADVVTAVNMQIVAGTFGGLCTITQPAAFGTCTATVVPTGFPWRATAVTTSNIQLHGVHIDLRLENPPGLSTCAGGATGASLTITGTVFGGNWTGNASHSLDFFNSEGLVQHSAFGNGVPLTTRGLLTDTQGTLTVS